MNITATPATVAAAITARRNRPATPAAPAVKTPAAPAPRRRDPITFTVRPKSLSDWVRWTHDLGAAGVRMDSTGEALVAHITVAGVPTRLVGEGVPALLRSHQARRSAGVREVPSHV